MTDVINVLLNKNLIPVLAGVKMVKVIQLIVQVINLGQIVVDSVIPRVQVAVYSQVREGVAIVNALQERHGQAHVIDVIVVHPVRLMMKAVVPVLHLLLW